MAALVHTSTPTIHQPRPSSAAGLLESESTNSFGQRKVNPRTFSYAQVASGASNMQGNKGYRGIASAPIAPYAFTSTPNTSQNPQNRQFANRVANMNQARTVSDSGSQQRQRYPAPASTSSTVSSSSSSNPSVNYQPVQQSRPMSTSLGQQQNLAVPSNPMTNTARPSPDRYRRNQRKADQNRNSLYSQPGKASSSSALPMVAGNVVQPLQQTNNNNSDNAGLLLDINFASTFDDMNAQPPSQQELVHRRRSFGAFDQNIKPNFPGHIRTGSFPSPVQNPQLTPPRSPQSDKANQMQPPTIPFPRRDSADSVSSHNSKGSSGSRTNSSNKHPAQLPTPSASPVTSGPPHELPLSNVQYRGSGNDTIRRTNPSPLSKPMTMSGNIDESGAKIGHPPSSSGGNDANPSQNAAERLAALQIDSKKGLKSRLRRAFSFGSAAELRQASSMNPEQRARLRQEREEVEQAKIAERQEAGGLGNQIYSNNQGNIFSGSTDNLSIQSTASSASVMLRKMGKGVKKGSRSLVGLFRPKSVIGVAPAAGPYVQSQDNEVTPTAQVSMVTVEAEREKVNVNVDPHDQAGGGTGFPKLERNSLDAVRKSIAGEGEEAGTRKSIIGNEKERAEVLAAMRKGILKRSTSSSPIVKPSDTQTYQLPMIPMISSNPSSPESIGGESSKAKKNEGDYFLTPTFGQKTISPRSSAVSAPVTPHEVRAAKAGVTFSQRITFHDTWTANDYDRRGEISTCNRLTPLLAQQIKEELNTFKMEMEVHEESKVYTHFF